MTKSESVTELFLRWRAGDQECLNRLPPPVEGGLRRIARHCMRMEREGDTLQTTALVNEAYLKLVHRTVFSPPKSAALEEALGVRPTTVKNDWRMTKLWLKRELSPKGADGG